MAAGFTPQAAFFVGKPFPFVYFRSIRFSDRKILNIFTS